MYFRYVGRELRRRARSASVVAIGLALGVALVITVTAYASGISAAQGQVLASLYGVGTDLTVTKVPTPGGGGSFSFSGTPPSRSQAGQSFAQDHLSSTPGLEMISAGDVTSISDLKDVAGATGALLLNSVHITGTFSGFGGGEGSSSATATPSPTPSPSPTPTPSPTASPSPSSSSAPFSISTFTVDGIDAADPGLGPLSGANITSGASVVAQWFTDVQQGSSNGDLPALVTSAYAKQNSIKAGSTVTIASTNFTVLGVISVSEADAADYYISLQEAQSLANETNDVNTIYVTADTAAEIPTIQAEIQKEFSSLTVTSAQDLASEVSGSLNTASNLAGSLGLGLSIAVLVAAFVLAILLTIASVTRRVREFGTLKAMGWRSRRIVGQVIGESAVQGLVGGVLGVGLGALGAFIVTRVSGPLQATVGATGLGGSATTFTGGGGAFGGGGFFGGGGGGVTRPSFTPGASFAGTFARNTHTVPVHVTAPLNIEILLLAIGLAIAGGVIAGILGGWRAARLQPAAALRRVE